MKYMLLIYAGGQPLNDAERECCFEEAVELARQLEAKGQFLASSPLQPVTTATSVRVRDGKRVVTDGPFAETANSSEVTSWSTPRTSIRPSISPLEFPRAAGARSKSDRSWKSPR